MSKITIVSKKLEGKPLDFIRKMNEYSGKLKISWKSVDVNGTHVYCINISWEVKRLNNQERMDLKEKIKHIIDTMSNYFKNPYVDVQISDEEMEEKVSLNEESSVETEKTAEEHSEEAETNSSEEEPAVETEETAEEPSEEAENNSSEEEPTVETEETAEEHSEEVETKSPKEEPAVETEETAEEHSEEAETKSPEEEPAVETEETAEEHSEEAETKSPEEEPTVETEETAEEHSEEAETKSPEEEPAVKTEETAEEPSEEAETKSSEEEPAVETEETAEEHSEEAETKSPEEEPAVETEETAEEHSEEAETKSSEEEPAVETEETAEKPSEEAETNSSEEESDSRIIGVVSRAKASEEHKAEFLELISEKNKVAMEKSNSLEEFCASIGIYNKVLMNGIFYSTRAKDEKHFYKLVAGYMQVNPMLVKKMLETGIKKWIANYPDDTSKDFEITVKEFFNIFRDEAGCKKF